MSVRLVMVGPGYSSHLEPWFEEFTLAGHEIVVYAYPPVTISRPGITVRPVPVGGAMTRARWLRAALAQDGPDIVSVHYASTDAFALARLSDAPLVISVWGSDVLRDLAGRPLKRTLVASALRRAALVISPAWHMTARLEALGVDAARILTSQYGVDTSVVTCPARPAPSGGLRVLSTRSLADVYQVEDLVRATALLAPDVLGEVRIAGDGPLREALERLVAELGVADRVAFLGRLDPTRIAGELCAADAYVSTSVSDGTSLSLLEAMSSGLVPVVSDIPANREWVEDGVSGLLFPVGDVAALAGALERTALEIDWRAGVGRAARERVLTAGDLHTNMSAIRRAVESLTQVRS